MIVTAYKVATLSCKPKHTATQQTSLGKGAFVRGMTANPIPPSRQYFLDNVNHQFLSPLSTSRLLHLSSALFKSYVAAAKTSPATMLPSHITTLPSGREQGRYLAVDLGGTNMRVALVRLQDNEATVEKLDKWIIPEAVKTGTAPEFFRWIAERIVMLAERSTLDYGEYEWKLGLTWSFPFA
jgi:hexokinase